MLTPQDIQLMIQKYLNSDDFEVLQHEILCNKQAPGYSSIKVKILTGLENKQREWENESSTQTPLDFCFTPTYITKGNVFLLEELSGEGFGLPKNSNTLDLEHIKVTLRTLAKYHSESLSSKLQEPCESKDVKGILESPLFKTLKTLIDLLPEKKIKHQEFKENLTTIVKDFLETIKTGNFRKISCQGYMCGESVLFKYNNEVPVECKLLNLNLQSWNPPTYDVLQFIFMVTNSKFRQNHLHELLQFYYDSLKNELEKKKLDIKELLPLEADFEISIHHLLSIIKVQTACFQQTQHLSSHFHEDIFNHLPEVVTESFKTDADYRKVMSESLQELEDLVTKPGLTLEDCFKIVKNKIGTENYDLLNYEILPMGNVSGFFGDHRKLKIDIRLNNQTETLNFFVKFTPKGKAQKSIADDCDSFYKENFFYRHFVPKAQEVGATIINDCTVPCYLTRLNDVIVFEDFDVRSYGILNRREPLALEVVQVIVKQMAKLHASSIILEEKLGEQTKTKYCLKEHYAKGLQESFFMKTENHQGAKSMAISIEAIEDQISLFPNPNSSLPDQDFKNKIKIMYESAYELVKPSKEYRNALCHGDLWVSNILVKQQDGKTMDCRFVDFQIMRYCPPAHDLLGFLYLTTNRSFRKQHLEEVLELYYRELRDALESCGCDAENIYSRENFKKSVEYMKPQAVCQTVIYYHICVTNPDLLKDYMTSEEAIKQIFLVDRRDFIKEMCEKDPLYRERNQETIEDLREICIKYF